VVAIHADIRRTDTPDVLLARLAAEYGVSIPDLRGRRQLGRIRRARREIARTLREVHGYSDTEIGELLHRHRSTANYLVQGRRR
jgi:chromosomal replication initiation ATPase DnaA